MSDFLETSELTESRAFIETFVKEIVVSPGNAVVPLLHPHSRRLPDTWNGRRRGRSTRPGTVYVKNGGPKGTVHKYHV